MATEKEYADLEKNHNTDRVRCFVQVCISLARRQTWNLMDVV